MVRTKFEYTLLGLVLIVFLIAGSDDDEEEEGSTAAMDGSALRTPPADAEPLEQEPGSGAGSESGASVNESIGK